MICDCSEKGILEMSSMRSRGGKRMLSLLQEKVKSRAAGTFVLLPADVRVCGGGCTLFMNEIYTTQNFLAFIYLSYSYSYSNLMGPTENGFESFMLFLLFGLSVLLK